MKALILAAGRGSRMKEFTSNKPKCLLKIKNISLIERQINNFKKQGINDIGIITGYKRDLLEHFNLQEFHNNKWDKTNMIYSLTKASKWLESDTCIVSYGDIFYEPSAIKSLLEDKSNLAITYDVNWFSLWSKRFREPLSDAETFKLDERNNLLKIGEKTDSLNEIEGQYMGIIKIKPLGWAKILKIINSIDEDKFMKIDFTSLLNLLICKDELSIKCIAYKDKWGEVDHPSDFKIYEKDL
jgi:choline kinase